MALKAVRDEDGGIVDLEWLIVNQMACRMLGRVQNSLLGKRLLVVLPGDQANGMFARYVQVVESGRPMDHEHRFTGPQGDGWFRITAVRLDEGLVVTFSDITAYKNR
jgi:PAS domain-containing protein